jgi:hypothetical protein
MIWKLLIGFTSWLIYRLVRTTINHLRKSCVRPLRSVDEMENRKISASAWDRIPSSRPSSTVVDELSWMLYGYRNVHSVTLSYAVALRINRNKPPQLKLVFVHIRRTAYLAELQYNKQLRLTQPPTSVNSTLSIFPRELIYIIPIEFFTVTKHI